MGIKISDLAASTDPPNTEDLLPIVQGGVTKRTTLGALFTQLLSFTPSGAGAVAKTVEDKERDIVSGKDFKNTDGTQVAGNGVQDDTTGIQRALDTVHAEGCGMLYYSAGTYLTGEIDWPGNGIALLAAGSGYAYNTSATPRTIFKAKAGTINVFDLVQTGTSEDRTNNILMGFLVDGNSIATN